MTSLTFHYDINIVGSKFNINNMKARIRHPLWCGTFLWHTLGALVLSIVYKPQPILVLLLTMYLPL